MMDVNLLSPSTTVKDVKLPALFTSVRNWKLNSIEMFLKAGQNLNSQDKNGMTPLHHVVTLKNLEVADLLINNINVDCSIVDINGNSVFHYMAYVKWNEEELKHNDFFKKLLDKGGSNVIDKPNKYGETPLHIGNVSSK